MNITEIEIVKANIKGQLVNKSIAPICLSGAPGTAKSTTVKLLADELNMNIVIESGPVLTHEALSGLPNDYSAPQYVASSIDGTTPSATQWSIPEIIAKTLRAAELKPTILLLDDFHMVSPHLQAYFYALLLERRLGNYKLPNNVAIVLTMNESNLAGFNGINSAVRNRMAILKIEFNFDYWFKNYGNRLHYMISSFLSTKQSYCQEDESTDVIGYGTARAWTAIANEFEQHTPEFLTTHGHTIAGMQVSLEAARALQAHIIYVNAIDFTKVVANRELVDLSKRDPLDTIIFAYITNFIVTMEDGLYLFELLQANNNPNSSSFIGFVMGDLYVKYSNKLPLTDGLRFVLNKLLNQPIVQSDYPNTTEARFNKVKQTQVDNIKDLMNISKEYLL